MNNINNFGPGSQIVLSDEQEAPPYVLHPYGSPAAGIETLPIYAAQHDPNAPITIQELNIALGIPNRIQENDVKVWQRYIAGLGGKQTDEEKAVEERTMMMHYFSAIKAGQEDLISLLIENNLVTASTKMGGMTPLLEAILNKNVRIAQLLIKLGADPNEFGSPVSSKTSNSLGFSDNFRNRVGSGAGTIVIRPCCERPCSSPPPSDIWFS